MINKKMSEIRIERIWVGMRKRDREKGAKENRDRGRERKLLKVMDPWGNQAL